MSDETTRDAEDFDLMTAEETAALLGIKETTLYKWRERGQGPPYIKMGGALRFRRNAVKRWLDESEIDPAAADKPGRKAV